LALDKTHVAVSPQFDDHTG